MTFIEMLRAYAEQKATRHEIARAAIEHGTWQLPLEIFSRGREGPIVAERLVMYGERTEAPAGHLWIFSDDEHGRRAAAGGKLGTFAADVPGTELFRNLEGITRIEINPGSPATETFFFVVDDGMRALLDVFARAISLEKLVDREAIDAPEVMRALRDFHGFVVFANPDDTIVTVPGQLGFKNAAAAFTAPDRALAVTAKVPPETMAGLRQLTLDGGQLFSLIPKAGVDGLALNLFHPTLARALDLDLCRRIGELA
jgi:hypothetical protein